MKELEAQLLIERKLARQHVDLKIAEQHLQKSQEQNNAPMRPALANRPSIGTLKNDLVSSGRPLTENNNLKTPLLPLPTVDSSIKYIDHPEKENNPEIAEKFMLPKRTGRASICAMVPRIPSATTSRRNSLICAMARRIPSVTASRRNSLIPLPSVPPSLSQFSSPLVLAPASRAADQKESHGELENCLTTQTHFESPKGIRSGSKKRVSNMLRRSIHKKLQNKSPIQQHMIRRVGVNVGMEKVRVSIGSRGKMIAQRAMLKNARRNGTEEGQQKNSHKEKERGWNSGTMVKPAF